MCHVSEYFICIPLYFPRRPWLYRKLSQWLINCPGRSMREPGFTGRADTVSVYSGMGNILVMLQTQPHETTCWYIKYGRGPQSECCYDISNNQKMSHVHHTYVLYQRRTAYLLHVRVILSLPQNSGSVLQQNNDKRSQATFVDVKLHSRLIASNRLQWHDIIRRKTHLHPRHCPLFGQLHHMGLPIFAPQLVGKYTCLILL